MVLGREKSRGSAGSIPVEKAAEIPVGFVGLGLMGNSIWGEPAHVLRFMDLTGVPAYGRVRKDLLPELCNSTEVPPRDNSRGPVWPISGRTFLSPGPAKYPVIRHNTVRL